MQVKDRYRPKPEARYLSLLLAIAGGLALIFFPTSAANRASAQGETPADRIAFTRDGLIYTVNPDGSGLVPVGGGGDPSWSQQGKIAFNYGPGDHTSIAVMNEDGTNLVVLTPPELPSAGQPDFSPDGAKILFVTDVLKTVPGEPAPLGFARIHVMDADGGNRRLLFTGDAAETTVHEFFPAWSPDGTRVAFIGQTAANSFEVFVANSDGLSAPIQLTNSGANRIILSQLAWSPDGQRLAFAAQEDIYVVNADGSGAPLRLTNAGQEKAHIDPAWSPDGTKIAYSVNFVDTDEFDGIYVMDADGQNPTFLNTTGQLPAWRRRDVTPVPTPTPTPTPSPTPTPEPTPTPTPEPTPTPVSADLAGELTASPLPIQIGQSLTYTLLVRNDGPDAAINVQAIFIRPENSEFVSHTASQGTCGPVEWDPLRSFCHLGDIAPGAQATVQVVVRPTSKGQLVAYSSVGSRTPDDNQSNNGQQLVLFADECVPEVTNQVGQHIWRPGNQSRRNVRHVIYVRNDSGRALHGLVHFVFEGLPESVEDGDPRTSFFRTRCAPPLGRKYTSVGVGQNELVWRPGQTIQLEVDFFNPDRVPLDYRLRIYTGPGYP